MRRNSRYRRQTSCVILPLIRQSLEPLFNALIRFCMQPIHLRNKWRDSSRRMHQLRVAGWSCGFEMRPKIRDPFKACVFRRKNDSGLGVCLARLRLECRSSYPHLWIRSIVSRLSISRSFKRGQFVDSLAQPISHQDCYIEVQCNINFDFPCYSVRQIPGCLISQPAIFTHFVLNHIGQVRLILENRHLNISTWMNPSPNAVDVNVSIKRALGEHVLDVGALPRCRSWFHRLHFYDGAYVRSLYSEMSNVPGGHNPSIWIFGAPFR